MIDEPEVAVLLLHALTQSTRWGTVLQSKCVHCVFLDEHKYSQERLDLGWEFGDLMRNVDISRAILSIIYYVVIEMSLTVEAMEDHQLKTLCEN